MEAGQSFDIIIRKMKHSDGEDLYRITVFRKLETMEELLLHPLVTDVIDSNVVRMERIDNFRYKVFVRKKVPGIAEHQPGVTE